MPPRLWGCRPHWFALPDDIRREIWKAYRPGQEIDKNPSAEYLAAAQRAQEFALSSRRRLEERRAAADAASPPLPFPSISRERRATERPDVLPCCGGEFKLHRPDCPLKP